MGQDLIRIDKQEPVRLSYLFSDSMIQVAGLKPASVRAANYFTFRFVLVLGILSLKVLDPPNGLLILTIVTYEHAKVLVILIQTRTTTIVTEIIASGIKHDNLGLL